MTHTRRSDKIILIMLLLFAFGLRLWQLDSVPPGWRDDELINSLVISQKAIDGDFAVYYADASGHEALYHLLNAFFLAVYGPSVAGIRWLSVFLGTLTIPLTYSVGRRFYNRWVGLVAAAALSVSFWSLMYSRIGLRHILTPLLALGAFYFFSKLLGQPRWRHVIKTAVFLGLGYYTYFASRGMPLIMLAFAAYLWLFFRPFLGQRWRLMAAALGLSFVFAVPLILTLQQQPESEARVAELAVPLVEARVGNFEPLQKHVVATLGMFHADGDDEWLYNIPHRPVFGTVGAIFFWLGVLIALGQALAPLWGRKTAVLPRHAQASALLLLWWLAGISPGFISIPPASLGHTILAQPAVFLLAALPIWYVRDWLIGDWRLGTPAIQKPISNIQSLIPLALGILFVATIVSRDWPAYFREWPQRGMVRFLYRADIHDLANYLNGTPRFDTVDFGVAGLLAGPWDKLALTADLAEPDRYQLRWFNPQRAIVLNPPLSFYGSPIDDGPFTHLYGSVDAVAGAYDLVQVTAADLAGEGVCFANGLCWQTAVYDTQTERLELGWRVGSPLKLPDIPLISNPPPPGVYAGSRLRVFAQLHDGSQAFLVGDDGLWVDPTTLQVDDIFLQQHWLAVPAGAVAETAVIGLYDPKTGERILTQDGRDLIRLPLADISRK